jgi:hypothetical protein
MKFNFSIALLLLITVSAVVFGQQPPVAPPNAAKPTTDTKTPPPPPPMKLPAASEIIAKYVTALGGKDAIMKAKTRMSKASVEIAPMGIKGTMTTYAVAPDKLSSKISLAGIGDLIEVFDGVKSWSSNPLQGEREKTGEELEQVRISSVFHRDAMLEEMFPKMTVKGVEKVDGRDAWVVEGTPAKSLPQTFFFDVENGLLVRQDMTSVSPEGKTESKTYFSDYRDVNGVKTPFKSRTVLPQFEMIFTTTEVKDDVTIDPAVFNIPTGK